MKFQDFMNQMTDAAKQNAIAANEQRNAQKRFLEQQTQQNNMLSKIEMGKSFYNNAMAANDNLHYSIKFKSSPFSELGIPSPTDNPFVEKIGDNWTEDQKNNYFYLLAEDKDQAKQYARTVNAYAKTSPVLANPVSQGQAQMEIIAKEIDDLERKKKAEKKEVYHSSLSGENYGSKSGFKSAEDYDAKIKKLKADYDLLKKGEATNLAKYNIKNYGSEEYKQTANLGYDKFLKNELEIQKTKDIPLWQKAIINNFDTASDTPIGTAVKSVQKGYREDRSYMLPNEDWTQEQKDIFGFYYNTNKQKAFSYAMDVNDAINLNKQQEQQAEQSTKVTKNWWSETGHSLLSVPANVIGGAAEYLDNIIEGSVRGRITNKATLSPQEYAMTVRQAVSENHEWNVGGYDVFDLLYNTAMSGADSIFAGVTMQGGAGVMLGASAAANTIDDIKSRGGNAAQAIIGGTVSGIFEGLFEQLSLGQLDNMKGTTSKLFAEMFSNGQKGLKVYAKQLAKDIAKSMVTNASEEFVTEIANILYDTLANGSISNYAQLVREYMNNGETEASARVKASGKLALQALEAGVSGALMGVLFGAGATTKAYGMANKAFTGNVGANYRDITTELIENGLESPEGTESRSLAEQYKRKVDSGKSLTNNEITKLVVANQKQIKAERQNNESTSQTALLSSVPTETISFALQNAKGNITFETLGITDQATQQQLIDSGVADASGNIDRTLLEMELQNRTQAENGYNALESAEYRTKNLDTSGFELPTKSYNKPSTSEISAVPQTEAQGATSELNNKNSPVAESSTNADVEIEAPTKSGPLKIKPLTAKAQNYIKGIGKSLGINVNFVNMREFLKNQNIDVSAFKILPEGAINKKTGDIYLSFEAYRPVQFLLKHELTHFAEKSESYKKFSQTVRNTDLYLKWLQEKTNSESNDRAVMEGKLMQQRMELQKGIKAPDAMREVIADFVGDKLFGENLEELELLLNKVPTKNRNSVIQFFIDFFEYLKKKFSNRKDMSFELSKLEDAFSRLLFDANNKTTAENNGGVEYAVKSNSPNYISNRYWYPDMSPKEIIYVSNVAKREIKTTENYIDIENKWLYNKLGDNTYFALYSTANENEPTILYACKNERAKLEYQFLTKEIIKEVDDNENINRSTERIKQLLIGYGYDISGKSVSDNDVVGRKSNNKNVGVYSQNTREKPSEALFNCLQNIRRNQIKREQSQHIKYSIDNNLELKLNDLQQEYRNLEKEVEELKQSKEYLDFLDSISTLQGEELDKAIKDYGEWTRKSGLYDKSKRISEIIGEQKDIRATLDNEKKLSRDAYMKSIENLTEKEKIDFVNKAVQRFGTTNKLSRASYLLLNGKMLDFSDGQGYRIKDHREISEILDMPEAAEYSDGLIAFMNMGNIRLQTYGIDISQSPNQAQKSTLRDIISQVMRENDEFSVDFSKANGYTDGSITYPKGTAVSKIILDIDNYFKTGEIPEYKSNIAEFRYSLPSDSAEALLERLQNGEITKEEYLNSIDKIYSQKVNENGKIKTGEMVTETNKAFPVPKTVSENTKVRQFVRTVLETGYATKEQEELFKANILSGKFSYTPISNEATIKSASKNVEKQGYEKAKNSWEKSLVSSTANANTVATGEILLKLAFEQKNATDILNITANLAELGTRTGQALQAHKLLKRMGGISQLVYVQRCVNKINQDIEKRFKHKANEYFVQLDETLAQQLAESNTEEEYEITYNAIIENISSQVPTTFLDKWNAWRYLSMLGNPVTHFRNLSGNAVFMPAVKMKNVIAAVTESALSKTGVKVERTKSVIVDKKLKDFAKKDFEKVSDIITGSGKYNPSNDIDANKKIFKTKFLEAARKKNFELLEKEDAIFLKAHYVSALGGYLQANKVDIEKIDEKTLAKAREYASQEALKATYRDTSIFANMISQASKTGRVANVLIEGVLPFKKTPINIAKRGIEYSPIGFLTTTAKGIAQLQKGEINVSQMIDGYASALTGTGLCLLGVLLAKLGVAVGGFDDDEAIEKLVGRQEYSIEIAGKSYTVDWMSPSSIPFFMGVAIAEYKSDEDSDILSKLSDFGISGISPILNLSLLSGIQDVISAARYAEKGEIIPKIVETAIDSYFSQALPTIFGKIANVVDDTRRTKYIDKTSKIPEDVQKYIDKLQQKTPFVSKTRAEYVDAWGRTQYTGNFIQRFFQQFVSPGYASTVNETKIETELKRLRESTGESGLFPSVPDKYLTIKGVRKDLSKEEYYNYAVFCGQTQADLISETINSAEYKKLSDENKAKVIKKVYSYASALAKCQLNYSYEEISAMQGVDKNKNPILTKEKYNRLDSKAKQLLVEEYFMESNNTKKAYQYAKKGKSVVKYFIDNVKE